LSHPYIIWTMRRTGGTTLAGLLEALSEHPQITHEPFNPDRLLGYITNTWFAGGDEARLEYDIRQALATCPVIKHCYELCAPELNDCLMMVASDLGYRHIILDRRAEDDRILSLELAEATDAWGGSDVRAIYGEIIVGNRTPRPINIDGAVTHMEHCLGARRRLLEILHRHGQAPFMVYFEDVYSDPARGCDLVRRLVEFVGLSPAEHPGYDALVDEALLTRGQNSAQIVHFVPGALELQAILRTQLRHRPLPFVAS